MPGTNSPRLAPRLVIFDCDGVLVDSETAANRLLCEAVNEAGWPITIGETHSVFNGRTMASCVEIIEKRLGWPLPADFLDRLEERTFAAFRKELRPVPGVREAIGRIDLADCVASSGAIEKMRLTLGLTGMLDHFDGRLFSAQEVARGKPAPDIFLHAAARMGVAPQHCIVVEDAVPGVEAGRAAGMRVLAYAGAAHADAAALGRAGGEVFTDMADLPGLIGRD